MTLRGAPIVRVEAGERAVLERLEHAELGREPVWTLTRWRRGDVTYDSWVRYW